MYIWGAFFAFFFRRSILNLWISSTVSGVSHPRLFSSDILNVCPVWVTTTSPNIKLFLPRYVIQGIYLSLRIQSVTLHICAWFMSLSSISSFSFQSVNHTGYLNGCCLFAITILHHLVSSKCGFIYS